ncbi:MAG: alpha/beta hydrolase [Burkholderiaceae bacterium]|nr:alpha/beta hydrolase [Burkholderiaceae bacterium]
MHRLSRWLAALVAGYAVLCGFMYAAQHALQYRPDPSPMNPAAVWLPQVQAETLSTPDGEHIVVWWLPPRHERGPVYLYLHGNGANLSARNRRLAQLTEDGAGLLAVSWRGYGGSSGRPHEAGLLTDARTALAALASRVDASRIVVFGESLGTAVAVMLASEVPVAGLVLDSSFASALDVARHRYPWLPVRWLLRDTYRADLAAPRVAVPVLQIHCRDDPVTPLASALRLQALLPGRRPPVMVEGRCHTPRMAEFAPALRRFVASLAGPGMVPAH